MASTGQASRAAAHHQRTRTVPLPKVRFQFCVPCSLPGVSVYVCFVSLAAAVLASLQSITSATARQWSAATANTSMDTSVPYAIILGVSDICRFFLQFAVVGVLFGQVPLSPAALYAAFPTNALQTLSKEGQQPSFVLSGKSVTAALAQAFDVAPVLQLLHFVWLQLQVASPKRAIRAQRILHYCGLFVICSWMLMAGILAEQAFRAVDPSFKDSISYKAYGGTDESSYTLEVFFLVFCFVPSNLGLVAAVWLLVCSSLISRESFAALQDGITDFACRDMQTIEMPDGATEHIEEGSSGPGVHTDTLLFIQALDDTHASLCHSVRLLSAALTAPLSWLLLLAGLGWVSALVSIIATASASGQLSSSGVIATLVSVAVSILAILLLLAAGASVTFSANMVQQTAATQLTLECCVPSDAAADTGGGILR